MARSRTRSGSSRSTSFGYVAGSLALAVLLLPTVFRPPQDQQNTTAAFSPDAPPDDTPPEVIIQSLGQARSSTAGSKSVAEEVVIIEEFAPEEKPPPRQAVRSQCYGDPPRQTESLYSPLCVPAFTGTDNGGATWQGVTADEVSLLVAVEAGTTVEAGKLGREFAADDQETERELKVWQTYVNERFEFYGRFLQVYVVKVSKTDNDQVRSAMREALAQHDYLFFMPTPDETIFTQNEEALREGIITWTLFNNPVEYFANNHPLLYSFSMDRDQQQALGAELICKQWHGRPPGDLNNRADTTFDYSAPRKFGLIAYVDIAYPNSTQQMVDTFADQCGGTFEQIVEYNLGDDAQQIAGATQRMRASGVTTIVLAIDPLTPPVLAYEALQARYMPEWVCVIGCQSNATGRLLPDVPSEHFVAISPTEIPRADADEDWYRAWKEIDPEGAPVDDYRFHRFLHIAGGVQHSGTQLDPEAFWKGLKTQPCRSPEPRWSIGGCYRGPDPSSKIHLRGDFTYTDYASAMWMDNGGDDPDSASAGAWCYMNFGARYGVGQMPAEPLPFRDPAQCWVTPPRGEQG